MNSKSKHASKSRIVISISILLFSISILSMVFIFTQHTDNILLEATDEAEHDLGFLSRFIKTAYLNKDYVEVERILHQWVKNNKLDTKVTAITNNGYELFYYETGSPSKDTQQVDKEIKINGKVILTLSLVRDISDIVSKSKNTRNNFLQIGIVFVILFGIIVWVLLHRFAFTPLTNEIELRHQAEEDIKNINLELEDRVEKRTASIKKLSSVVEKTDDIVVISNADGLIEYVNPSFEKTTGYSSDEVMGKKSNILKSGSHNDKFYQDLWKTISTGKSFRETFINRKKDGSLFYEEKTITPLKNEDNKIINYVSTGKDISDRIEAQNKLHYLATHDALTNLPNKLMITDRLSHAIEQAKRFNTRLAVLFMDLDQFKHINDSLGHPVGDSLLINVANILSDFIRKSDSVGRFGGDEFIFIIESVKNTNNISQLAQQILEKISHAMIVDNYEITTSASIGITIFPDDSDDVDTLFKNADVAMYKAKSKGGNSFQFYTQEMSDVADKKMELQLKLNHALENNEFSLCYQPKLNLKSGKLTGMEALLRWNNPELGNVIPDNFIPILEETGKIIEVGQWVFQTACDFNNKLIHNSLAPLCISINLSSRQFHDPNLLNTINTIIQQIDFEPGLIEIELTESILVDNVERAIHILDELHHLGLKLSIDDFGTGYSSMSYLKRFPIDTLKIDRSFVHGLPEDKDDIAIIKAIQALANSLGLKLVAEGIETKEQLQFFQYIECHEIQGFFYSKPLTPELFTAFYKNEKTVI